MDLEMKDQTTPEFVGGNPKADVQKAPETESGRMSTVDATR